MAEQKESELLVALDEYIGARVHIGTNIKTKDAGKFIYRVNPDGLCVLNVSEIDKRIRMVAKFLASYSPEDVAVFGGREQAKKALGAFSKYTGIRVFAGRYPVGLMTNPEGKNYFEPRIVLVVDPYLDKNPVHDAYLSGIAVFALFDSNNLLRNVDFAIPCNNKGANAVGVVFYLIAREYLRARGELPKDKDLPIKEFKADVL